MKLTKELVERSQGQKCPKCGGGTLHKIHYAFGSKVGLQCNKCKFKIGGYGH